MQRSSILAFLFLVPFVSFSAFANAQAAPLSFSLDRDALTPLSQVEQVRFDALDLATLAQQDALRESGGGNIRFAFPHAVALGTERYGQWDEAGDFSIWRLRVSADEATLINFGFENVQLPEGS